MRLKIAIVTCLIAVLVVVFILNTYLGPILISRGNMIFDDNISLLAAAGSKKQRQKVPAQPPITIGTQFSDDFSTEYTLKEAGNSGDSLSRNWWLSSGAYLYSANGIGGTIIGDLPTLDPWRVAFSLSNPLDTDNGYHPQNIFRLVSISSKWKNLQQEAYFKIVKDNLSPSQNRNASNGLLFFNRYEDEFNLYYTGIRVDGYAVIKKKINGAYYTLAYKQFIKGLAWNKDSNPNMLPKDTWIGLRSNIQTKSDGTVSIKLYVDNGKTGNWILAAEAIDDSKSYGGQSILNAGYAGIRTDFMDVMFDDYKIAEQ